MGDESEWMKLPTDQKVEHKVRHVVIERNGNIFRSLIQQWDRTIPLCFTRLPHQGCAMLCLQSVQVTRTMRLVLEQMSQPPHRLNLPQDLFIIYEL